MKSKKGTGVGMEKSRVSRQGCPDMDSNHSSYSDERGPLLHKVLQAPRRDSQGRERPLPVAWAAGAASPFPTPTLLVGTAAPRGPPSLPGPHSRAQPGNWSPPTGFPPPLARCGDR